MRLRLRGVALLIALASPAPLLAQSGATRTPRRTLPTLAEALADTRGPKWDRARSRHFALYAERGTRPRYDVRALLDSLEEGWAHAGRLLGATPPPTRLVSVFVTRTPARFPDHLRGTARGVAMLMPEGDVVIIVHNEETRAFIRHEVMHVVASRVLGSTMHWWIAEGIAAWADGRCGPTSIEAVARDELRREPGLTVARFASYFRERGMRSLGDRHAVYSMAGTLVASAFEHGGLPALRALWRADLTPNDSPLVPDSLTVRWRSYVERASAGHAALPSARLIARGCG